MARPIATEAEIQRRFWSLVRISDGCWEWTGALDKDGYGRHFHRTGAFKSHRYSYEISVGPIPDELHVCHHCDNPACVRPDHLFLGTRSDNMRDCMRKGRAKNVFQRAALCKSGQHALTEGNRGPSGCKICRRAFEAKWRRTDAAKEYQRQYYQARRARELSHG